MDSVVNFEELSDAEFAQFVQDHHAEFGEEYEDNKAEQIMLMLRDKGTVIDRHPFGFAIIHPEGSLKERGIGFAARRQIPVLWYLYIAPSARGVGVARNFIVELRQKYANASAMSLLCYGDLRRDYFARNGFAVVKVFESDDAYAMDHPGSS